MQQENRVSKDEVWSIINLICYRHAKSSLQDFNMKTKISKKAFDSGNNLPSSWRRKKKSRGHGAIWYNTTKIQTGGG